MAHAGELEFAMYVCTCLTSPEEPTLDGTLVASLRNAWGGGTIDWLAPDEAAEFPLTTRPGNFQEVWDSVNAIGVDLVVQPQAGRRKALLLADMDSTMIQQECIDELAEAAGAGAEVRAVTARAMNGELDFEEALRARVSVLAGLDVAVIDRVLHEQITLMPGGATLLATMKANGAHAALVSGGFTDFTSAIAVRLGFDEHRANQLLRADGTLIGATIIRPLGRGNENRIAIRPETTAKGTANDTRPRLQVL